MSSSRSSHGTGAQRPRRSRRLQRTAAVVPLALLSAAWTAGLTNGGMTPVSAAPEIESEPTGLQVPAEAIEAPASVSEAVRVPGSVGGFDGSQAQQIVSTSSTNGIPSAALAAYQRAETVINAADPGCRLNWQLIAAIGRVESDHGRFGGNVLDTDGVAQPGIVGIALDGTNNTALIRDTDGGEFDGDTAFDRAVGPMQFIPSTWASVGVDADDDGARNPQDIDDAALGTAVYLCSGAENLSTEAGQRSAVYRYNHSTSYVDLVLSIMNAYLDGDFMTVPDGTQAAGFLTPAPVADDRGRDRDRDADSGTDTGTDATPDADPTADPAPEPEPEADPEPTRDPEPEPEPEPDPEPTPDEETGGPRLPLPTPSVTLPPLPETDVEPVDRVLTYTQAVLQCTVDGLNPVLEAEEFDVCVEEYMSGERDPKD